MVCNRGQGNTESALLMPAVDLAAMSDAQDDDQHFIVLDAGDDPVVADAVLPQSSQILA